jgi:1-piperideine-2-carboxylate/1-pyrroline-2-carboxylate reductase [NAD(P)H]
MKVRHLSSPLPSGDSIPFFGPAATAEAVPFAALVEALAQAALEYQRGEIRSPERLSVPLAGDGVSLSMPASAADVAIHKLVNVQPANAAAGLPSLHGVVTVTDTATGRPLCFLDGPELTGRRTAGISMLGIRLFLSGAPQQVVLIGTGVQASFHVRALADIYPACRILVKGIDRQSEMAFCNSHASMSANLEPCPAEIPHSVQVAITLTTSKKVVYDEPASAARLVIGVGAFKPDMAEIGSLTLGGSAIYADDAAGARHEAGDLIRAEVDWNLVKPLAMAVAQSPSRGPVVLKSVGTAAWDLAASRVALRTILRNQ